MKIMPKYSVLVIASKLVIYLETWNSLPGDLRSASSLSIFRNKLKLMLHHTMDIS